MAVVFYELVKFISPCFLRLRAEFWSFGVETSTSAAKPGLKAVCLCFNVSLSLFTFVWLNLSSFANKRVLHSLFLIRDSDRQF